MGASDSFLMAGAPSKMRSPSSRRATKRNFVIRGARFPPAVVSSLQRQGLQVLARGAKQILDRAVIGP